MYNIIASCLRRKRIDRVDSRRAIFIIGYLTADDSRSRANYYPPVACYRNSLFGVDDETRRRKPVRFFFVVPARIFFFTVRNCTEKKCITYDYVRAHTCVRTYFRSKTAYYPAIASSSSCNFHGVIIIASYAYRVVPDDRTHYFIGEIIERFKRIKSQHS